MGTTTDVVVTDHVIELCDGSEAVIRPISPADAEALRRFHAHLSARSIQMRYFYPHPELLPDELTHLTLVDGVDRVAQIVERCGELVAVGRYDRLEDRTTAEVAFVVADEYQHHGLAAILLHQLIERARTVGITRLVAEVLVENAAMLSVFRHAGLPIRFKTEWGVVVLTMSIDQDRCEVELLDGYAPEQASPAVLSCLNQEAPA
jgi:RimJ/RimL family protein N-acetyltransferase